MVFDSEFWVLLAFISFIILFGRKFWNFITTFLDEYINHVKTELNDAEQLKKQAELQLQNAELFRDKITYEIRELKNQSQQEIEHLKTEHEELLKKLTSIQEINIKKQIDSEINKQKEKIIDILTEQILQQIKTEVLENPSLFSVNLKTVNWKKLIT